MNFEDDDLLGDILSDGSNDSFFDDPKLTTKKSGIKNLEKPAENRSEAKPDDWLGLGTSTKDAKAETKIKDDWLGLGKPEQSKNEFDITKSPIRAKKPIKKISFEDDDILGSLGISKKPEKVKTEEIVPQEVKARKSDFLESILKGNKGEEELDILKPSDLNRKEAGDSLHQSAHMKSQDMSAMLPRESRRKRGPSGLIDPLGLFSEDKNETTESQTNIGMKNSRAHSLSLGDIKDDDIVSTSQLKSSTSRSTPNLESTGLPDWLGGSSKSKTSEFDIGTSSVKSKSDITLSDRTENTTERPIESRQTLMPNIGATTNPNTNTQEYLMDSLMVHQKMAQSHMDYQNTAMSLQQQESQVLIALQMRKYEDNLLEIQRQQQETLIRQEQQFNALLERQFAKQNAMENNMRLQQERINSHIQLLLSQPRMNVPIQQLQEEVERVKETAEEEHMKAYQSMINNLKQRQHEELFLMEESYKKQISLLEETTNNTESRLKTELEAALQKNEESSKFIQEQQEKELIKFRKRIEELEDQHSQEMKLIRDNNTRVLDEIKYEHNLIIENIKESKRSENSVLKESGEFGQKLDANLQLLQNNSQILQNVYGKIEADYGSLYMAREETLRAKEKEIRMMREALEKCRESTEMEKLQLLGLVRSLETKMAEQSQSSREERWTLQQAISTLATRSAAFDREMEFSKGAIERERKQLDALKESLLAEQEKVMLQLTEEKLIITAEKARLETRGKLHLQYDSQRAKAELEAAIQVAKEAVEMSDRDRDALQTQICETESLKRSLQDKERKLTSREMELSSLSQLAEQKVHDGEKALLDAKAIETKCNERMKQLQIQLMQLSNREKKITDEKIALSKERITLNNLMRERKTCSLCTADSGRDDEPKPDWNNDFTRNEVTPFPRFDVSDAEIIRLQFEEKEENLSTAYKLF